ncbi:MAG: ABC transporter ATP-binding protein, partial [Planctomycetaceae bacterium]|nr:ABC transporter ATP-binding protein [Planctomycetaceae bacterium]
MPSSSRSSRQRFTDYLEKLAARRRGDTTDRNPHSSSAHSNTQHGHRTRLRSTGSLLREFWRLLRGQRKTIAFALATLTVSTVLALIPPAATKFLVDYVFPGKPLPPDFPFRNVLPANGFPLLLWITVSVFLVSATKVGFQVWGRWYATRATKRLQMSVRRKLFEHAVRLPLTRVQDLKSGGMASLLREDTGSIGDLV